MRVATAAIMLFLSASSVAHASGAQAQSPEAEVHIAIADMNRAAERLDADQFMISYWNSPSLTITFDGQTMRGWQTILDQQREWWRDKNAGIKFVEQRAPEIVVQSADVVTSIQWITVGTATEGDKPAQLVITSIWKKLAEGWRIVLAHESLVS